METSLHRQLKAHYAPDGAQLEQRIGRYRIDVIDGDELIEIQLGSLSAIRDKIAVLVKRASRADRQADRRLQISGEAEARRRARSFRGAAVRSRGPCSICSRSWSTSRASIPIRGWCSKWCSSRSKSCAIPGHGRRRRWRRNDHEVEDQRLVAVLERREVSHGGRSLPLVAAEAADAVSHRTHCRGARRRSAGSPSGWPIASARWARSRRSAKNAAHGSTSARRSEAQAASGGVVFREFLALDSRPSALDSSTALAQIAASP